MLRNKLAAFLTAGVMMFGMMSSAGVSAAPAKNGEMRDMTTMELVRDMGIGINLGNTMEACGDWIAQYSDGSVNAYETSWGSPTVTKEMIEGMADEGFGVVRVPVAWSNRMKDDGTYTIDAELTARIQQIVDWVIDADMYCIINIHWDNGWVNKFPEDEEGCMKRYEIMWTQIADAFKDYDDHLMFESQNEELGWESIWNPWSGSDAEKAKSYDLCNRINQKFVDVIRSSDGNNPKRHLLISGYNTGFDRTCDPLFKMPSDPANRMAVSVHYYNPAGFAILEDEDASWAKARATWGTDDDFKDLAYQMDMMKTNYIDKGIPVIIGEYGCPTKGKEPESVRLFLSSVCKAAYERQMCPVLWATPADGKRPEDTLSGHYNRKTYQLCDPELKKAFNELTGFTGRVHDTTEETTEATTEETTLAPTEDTTAEITTPLKGDIDGNGEVNISDVILLQKWLLGMKVTLPNPENAELTDDDSIDVFDLARLKQLLVQKKQ